MYSFLHSHYFILEKKNPQWSILDQRPLGAALLIFLVSSF